MTRVDTAFKAEAKEIPHLPDLASLRCGHAVGAILYPIYVDVKVLESWQ